MSLTWKNKRGIITFVKWEMEISFISEVGKKKMFQRQVALTNSGRGRGDVPRDDSTRQGPKNSAHRNCTGSSAEQTRLELF